jgi:hypothetical protein
MELLLTQADLAAMPGRLRRDLFLYLGGAVASGEIAEADSTTSLTREEGIGLLRQVSFHQSGAHLRVLLERMAFAEQAKPLSKKRLLEIVKEDSIHLGRYIASLNRMTGKIVGHPGAKLCRYDKATETYAVHVATRNMLRELLTTMKASGTQEEPLWE